MPMNIMAVETGNVGLSVSACRAQYNEITAIDFILNGAERLNNKKPTILHR